MIAAPIPTGKVERLADLRFLEILDTPPELRFDRIVRQARSDASFCGVLSDTPEFRDDFSVIEVEFKNVSQ